MNFLKTPVIPILVLGIVISVCSAGSVFFVGQWVFYDAELLTQKNEELESLKAQEEHIREFQDVQRMFSSDIQSLENLFVDPENPIEFLEFLEHTGQESGMNVEVVPNAPVNVPVDPWRSMVFSVTARGPYASSMRFLESLDSAPYLIEVKDVTLATYKGTTQSKVTDLSVSIKAYVK